MAAQKANYESAAWLDYWACPGPAFTPGRHGRPQRRKRDELDAKVRKVFTESDEVYVVPRAYSQLAYEGTTVNRKTVATSMLRQGLQGISPKKFTPVTTNQKNFLVRSKTTPGC